MDVGALIVRVWVPACAQSLHAVRRSSAAPNVTAIESRLVMEAPFDGNCTFRGACAARRSGSVEQEDAEVPVLVEAGTDGGPFPLGQRAVVVIHPVEIGAPAAAGPWRRVVDPLEKGIGDEELGRPALDGGALFLRPTQIGRASCR